MFQQSCLPLGALLPRQWLQNRHKCMCSSFAHQRSQMLGPSFAYRSIPCSWKKAVRSLSLACTGSPTGGQRQQLCLLRMQRCHWPNRQRSRQARQAERRQGSAQRQARGSGTHQGPEDVCARDDAHAGTRIIHNGHAVDLVLQGQGAEAEPGAGQLEACSWSTGPECCCCPHSCGAACPAANKVIDVPHRAAHGQRTGGRRCPALYSHRSCCGRHQTPCRRP